MHSFSTVYVNFFVMHQSQAFILAFRHNTGCSLNIGCSIEISYTSNLKVFPSGSHSSIPTTSSDSFNSTYLWSHLPYDMPPLPMLWDQVGHFHLHFRISGEAPHRLFSIVF